MSWTMQQVTEVLRRPQPQDDKYSRGVLGVITGSPEYPGAAVLGVEAALHTGIGMVRYLGDAHAAVCAARPEAVIQPGRVNAWLVGSGITVVSPTDPRIAAMTATSAPVIADAGALDPLVLEQLRGRPSLILTPHHGEAARLVKRSRDEVAANPSAVAREIAETWNATVVLKGSRTHIVGGGAEVVLGPANPWLATAGTGDVLGGILGALAAARPDAPAIELAASAVWIHSAAADRFAGPILARDLAAAVSSVVAEVLQ